MYNYDDLSITEIKDLFRRWRETNERKSDEVLELWSAVLEDNINKLGNEKYIIIEQALVAALDCHKNHVVKKCLGILWQHFPFSSRVLKYEAARYEIMGDFDKALEVLDEIIKNDETNSAARKRRVAVLKSQGLISEAIKELVDYLKKFMSDVEGWQELCELYLQVQDYNKAVFCAEELLLHQPHSHLFQQKVADIRYTMGGVENLELAKTYYCHTLKLNPENIRALLGLFLVTNNLTTHYKSSGTSSKRKDVWKLNQWAQQAVSRKYREAEATGPLAQQQETPAVDAMLLSLSLAE